MSKPKSSFWSSPAPFAQALGVLLLLKGILGFLRLLLLEYIYANSRTLNIATYKLPLFVLNLAFPFSIFLGLYFTRVFLGSTSASFHQRLASLNPSKYKIRPKFPSSTSPQSNSASPSSSSSSSTSLSPAVADLLSRPAPRASRPVPRLRALVLTITDLLLSALALYSLPELAFFYYFLIAEFLFLPLFLFFPNR